MKALKFDFKTITSNLRSGFGHFRYGNKSQSVRFLQIVFILTFIFPSNWIQASPLAPLKLDHPRDTFETYWSAMTDYNRGVETNDPKLKKRIKDAARCFDLSETPYLLREEVGIKAAQQLKEVVDRVILIDFKLIPKTPPSSKYWRLKDTEISIVEIESGERKGQYLFSSETTRRLDEFYKTVKDLPYIEGSTQGAHYKEPWNEQLPPYFLSTFLGFKVWQWFGLLASLLFGLIFKSLAGWVVSLSKKITENRQSSTKRKIILALEKPIGLITASAFWFLCIHLLRFEGLSLSILLTLNQVMFSASVVWACYRLSEVLIDILTALAQKTESDLDDELVPLFAKALRIFIVVIGVLVTVQNLGFNVMSLVAGLGLGGLAFALAAKDAAANLFGSLMILLDRPFRLGDWIIAADVEGNVESVGFRSTRIRTFYNSLISVPNSQLANSNIDNMGERQYRRCKTTIGVTYSTTQEQMQKFIDGIKSILLSNEHTRKDYFHVYFNDYGPSSLNILLYFFLDVSDWSLELKGKEEVFMAIKKLAQELEVEFAFPTQTLHIESAPPIDVKELKPRHE